MTRRACSKGLLVLLGLASAGCYGSRTLGVRDGDFVSPQGRTHLACVQKDNGRRAEIVDHAAGGKDTVDVFDARVGLPGTLDEVHDVDGMKVFAAQRCQMRASPLCDDVLFVRRGDQRLLFTWVESYPSERELPTSTSAIVEALKKRQFFALVRDLDIDAPTYTAFASLSNSRREASVRAGARPTKRAGPHFEIEIDEREKPLVDGYPKLVPILETLTALGHGATVCFGRAPGG